MNFAAGGDYVMVNTPGDAAGDGARGSGSSASGPSSRSSTPATSCMVNELIRDGLIDDPALIQLCMGIPYGAPNDPTTLLAIVARLPPGSVFSAFSIGRMQLPYVALAVLAGGNVRVGLEDNLYLSRGVLATNGAARRARRDDPRGDERARPRPRRGARASSRLVRHG